MTSTVNKKLKAFLVFLVFALVPSWLIGQNLHWVKPLDGSSVFEILRIETDQNGNVFIGAIFNNLVDADPGPGTYNLTTSDFTNGDLFIAKYDVLGNFLWAGKYGGLGTEYISAMKLDSAGNVFVTGPYTETADLRPGSGVFNQTANGGFDSYIIKLSSNGIFQWAASIGGSTGNDFITSFSPDETGGLYYTGVFEGSVDFDPGIGTTYLSSLGKDIFCSHLSSSGILDWAFFIGGTGNEDESKTILRMYPDKVILGAKIFGTADLNPGVDIIIAGTPSETLWFELLLDSGGNYLSLDTTIVGGTFQLDADGNKYYFGTFSDSIDLDPGPTSALVYGMGTLNPFIAKYNSFGDFIWGKGWDWVGNGPLSWHIDQLPNGTQIIGGKFQYTNDFDPSPGMQNLTPFGGTDGFLLKIDSTGTFQWVIQIGASQVDIVHALCAGPGDAVYYAGLFDGTIDFDPGIGITTLNGENVLFSRLFLCNPLILDSSITSCEPYLSPSGNYLWNSSGTHQDFVFNSEMCDSLFNIDLNIPDFNVAIVYEPPYLISSDGTADYQWIDCLTNLAIPAETLQFFLPNTNGEFAVIVSKNGCSDTSSCFSISDVGVAKTSKQNINLVKLGNQFYFETLDLNKPISLTVLNILGKVQMKLTLTPFENFCLNLPFGIYFLMTNQGNNSKVFYILNPQN